MGKPKINSKLLPVKAHYFLYNAGTAAWMPFIPVFARQIGISEVGVGAMYAAFPFGGLILRPICGAIADKFQIHRFIFLFSILVMTLGFAGPGFIPPLPHEQKGHFHCTPLDSYLTVKAGDDCLLHQLQETPDSMKCDLLCHPLNEVQPEDCTAWGLVHEECSEIISMAGYFNLSKADKLNDTLYFKIDELHVGHNLTEPRCANRTEFHCDISCNNTYLMTHVRTPVPVESPYGTDQFIALFSLTFIAWSFFSVSVSMSDSLTFAVLGADSSKYGAQRLWGAVGWGVLITLTGFIIEVASSGLTYTNYTPCFIILIVLMGLDLVVASRIKAVIPPATNAAFSEAFSLLANPSIIVFFLSIMLVGMCTGFLWQFLFWYIEDLMKVQGCGSISSIKLLQGLVGGFQCLLGELPFFFLSGWIVKKLGHVHCMSLVLLAMALRLVLYSVISNPWYFLPVELLQGLTLGLFWSTMASYAYVVAPPGVAATMQGVVGAVFEGVGTALGSFLGGILYNKYGGQMTYFIFGISALIGSILHCVSNLLISRMCPMKPRTGLADMEIVDDLSSEEAFSQVQYKTPQDAVKLRDLAQD
ncbi:major facilitator superfamily domain-containing protein 6-like isoform X1 [Artemia franciscana]|uniref:Major facilitator superfamily (MFS) profile domain-containing protein n=1 Tax=Artemia franciscana TaxID=6661 RepID=A0AA88I1C3_ARTSF|nr:hypothetical protein QYM36_009354 [Artemia franciscana]